MKMTILLESMVVFPSEIQSFASVISIERSEFEVSVIDSKLFRWDDSTAVIDYKVNLRL